VVRLLLEREEVDPDVADNDGGTPLFFTRYGHYGHNPAGVLLQSRKAVTPTTI